MSWRLSVLGMLVIGSGCAVSRTSYDRAVLDGLVDKRQPVEAKIACAERLFGAQDVEDTRLVLLCAYLPDADQIIWIKVPSWCRVRAVEYGPLFRWFRSSSGGTFMRVMCDAEEGSDRPGSIILSCQTKTNPHRVDLRLSLASANRETLSIYDNLDSHRELIAPASLRSEVQHLVLRGFRPDIMSEALPYADCKAGCIQGHLFSPTGRWVGSIVAEPSEGLAKETFMLNHRNSGSIAVRVHEVELDCP